MMNLEKKPAMPVLQSDIARLIACKTKLCMRSWQAKSCLRVRPLTTNISVPSRQSFWTLEWDSEWSTGLSPGGCTSKALVSSIHVPWQSLPTSGATLTSKYHGSLQPHDEQSGLSPCYTWNMGLQDHICRAIVSKVAGARDHAAPVRHQEQPYRLTTCISTSHQPIGLLVDIDCRFSYFLHAI